MMTLPFHSKFFNFIFIKKLLDLFRPGVLLKSCITLVRTLKEHKRSQWRCSQSSHSGARLPRNRPCARCPHMQAGSGHCGHRLLKEGSTVISKIVSKPLLTVCKISCARAGNDSSVTCQHQLEDLFHR